ncbi:hypothetical protein JCM15457_974 [Liquorilactobacillus sucicola DSM 21376 = JCM 15457]|uniref:DUF2969 domain-containing protein n=1 Tax=Liquorilactobacillus sucicola DSM 21376 = JCM 15457 TaxID=1423806 RepID=A0A023CVX9_9LACO|nr:DUF2969 domain-containing protein [Liquorilactobacillus sucicola]KRN06137.1 hypothetical protein FD15_GL001333 [Liquorilactobacillus sucicola DSM 21376 = JCM 15457]GAJ26063.1 hypothetical protein JCM15457_974 [Liquorilactobacillus sucicola DSM 21376 = JCM 15457]
MARREKNVEIFEEEKMVNGNIVLELKTEKNELGSVRQDGNRFVVLLPNGETFKASSQKEAINILIRDYHLHRVN